MLKEFEKEAALDVSLHRKPQNRTSPPDFSVCVLRVPGRRLAERPSEAPLPPLGPGPEGNLQLRSLGGTKLLCHFAQLVLEHVLS